MERTAEIETKLEQIRRALGDVGAAAVRLRGLDWFAWATAGGSAAVLLAAETGVAEVLVTSDGQWVLTDEIEAERLSKEELPSVFTVAARPWAVERGHDTLLRDVVGKGTVLSDRPAEGESRLPPALVRAKRTLLPSEIERYRVVGRAAAEAMTDVLTAAQPTWTERDLAGAGAAALLARGLDPALILCAGERRLPLYRHPPPRGETLGRRAMLVFCARGAGLYANLTRFVGWSADPSSERIMADALRRIEADALDTCRPGVRLSALYERLGAAYQRHGYARAIAEHHQGGTTGYLSREVIARPGCEETLDANMALALNPSLPGTKIEDTFVLREDGSLENLTLDPRWPTLDVGGRARPLPLES